VHQHFDHSTFRNLGEAGSLPARRGMHVQRIVGRAGALRRKLRGELGEVVQVAHLLLGQQVVHVGPTFQALRCADLHEAPAGLQHLQPFAVLERGDGIGLGSQILAQVDGGWTRVRDSRGGRLLFGWFRR
jgi:hypothetical protein